VHQPVDLGDREAADHADILRLGQRAGDDAGQVGGILDIVVEHREIGMGVVGLETRPHQEGGVGVVGGDGARGVLDPKHLADDELVAGLAIFAHHALVVAVGDVFGKHIVDVAAVLGGVGGLVDAAHPLLLDGHGVDRGDLDRLLGEQPGGHCGGAGKGSRGAGGLQDGAARDEGAC
jgi:hypothetical protein